MSTDRRPNVFPALRYRDAPAAIDWLVAVFGFQKQAVFTNPAGAVAHAQLQLGPAVIGLNSAHDTPGNPWSGIQQGIYVRVDNVDALHGRAAAAGADIVSPLTDMDYGSREFSARDLEGHLWAFGTYDMDQPTGDPAVFPEIHYRSGAQAMAFLANAFGFEELLEVPGPDGTIVHGEMHFGPGIVMVGSGPDGADVWGRSTHCTHVYVADPDAHFARARAGGAAIARRLTDAPWGRGYVARDVEGFLWGFSTYRPRVGS